MEAESFGLAARQASFGCTGTIGSWEFNTVCTMYVSPSELEKRMLSGTIQYRPPSTTLNGLSADFQTDDEE